MSLPLCCRLPHKAGDLSANVRNVTKNDQAFGRRLLEPSCRAEHRRYCRTGPQGADHDGTHAVVDIRDVPSTEPRKCREAQGVRDSTKNIFVNLL